MDLIHAYNYANKLIHETEKSFTLKVLDTHIAYTLRAELISLLLTEKNIVDKSIWPVSIKLFIKRLWYNKIFIRLKPFDFVFFLNTKSHLNSLIPIAENFRLRGLSILVLTTKENLFIELKERGFRTEYVLGASPLSQSEPTNQSNNGSSDSNRFYKLIHSTYPKSTFLLGRFMRILKQVKPKYIFIGNDNLHEGRLLALTAKNLNIPIGTVQHGSLSEVNPLHGESIADQFFVYGERAKEALVKLGKDPKEIIISGLVSSKSFIKRTEKIKLIDLQSATKLILICFSGPGHSVSESHHWNLIESIIKYHDHKTSELLIKIHPKESKTSYKSYVQQGVAIWDNNDLVAYGASLNELILKSSVVITGGSTVALEACLLGQPVITVDFNNELESIDFISDGLTYHVKSQAELEAVLKKLPNKVANKEKLGRYYHNIQMDDYDPIEFIYKSVITKIQSLNN